MKVLLSVGGGISTNDGLWVNMASDPNKIDNFISSVSQIIRSNDFDGLNIDWHYPQESDKVWTLGILFWSRVLFGVIFVSENL